MTRQTWLLSRLGAGDYAHARVCSAVRVLSAPRGRRMDLSVACAALTALLVALPPTPMRGQAITEIIETTGDGAGNTRNEARSIAVGDSGDEYLTGQISDNAFKITQSVLVDADGAVADSANYPQCGPSNNNYSGGIQRWRRIGLCIAAGETGSIPQCGRDPRRITQCNPQVSEQSSTDLP